MKYLVLARYGAMHQIGTFSTQIKNLAFGEKCILRTDRGTEWGEAISEIERAEGEPIVKPEGTILRRVTPKDYDQRRHIEDAEQPKEYSFCADKIQERTLPMRLVSVEHIFGGEKIIFYFLADGRVDFRQLVKDLATEYKTRIELRQIGVRDEARLLAEYEHCGRELCCRTFIKDLEPVTMRMAKLQKTTLDPTKISGRCGRLMCCLRFEDEAYADLKARLPKKGTRVRISEGIGDVVSSEILAQTVTVEMTDHKFIPVKLSDILETLPGGKPKDDAADTPPATPDQKSDDSSGQGSRRSARNRRRRDQDQEPGDRPRQPQQPQRPPQPSPQDDRRPQRGRPDVRPQGQPQPTRPTRPEQPRREDLSLHPPEPKPAELNPPQPAEPPPAPAPLPRTELSPRSDAVTPPDEAKPTTQPGTPPPPAPEPADTGDTARSRPEWETPDEWWEGPDDTED